jgi:hypothetical protein
MRVFEGPWTEKVGILYGHLEYILAMWNIFCPFGIYFGHLEYILAIWNIFWPIVNSRHILVYFPPPFWYKIVSRKIWQPCLQLFAIVSDEAQRPR